MESTLRAGFAKVKITPDFPASLSGYGGDNNRFYTDVVEDLYLTCISVANKEKTLLVFTVDTCGLLQSHQKEMREEIEQETGIPASCIFFGATHAHNGCSMYPTGLPQAQKFVAWVKEKARLAAREALADLAPASLFAGMPSLPGMNYTRHYLAEDGKKYSANLGFNKEAVLVGHATKSDPGMSMVKFKRKEKKDIIMVNWQAHPDSAYAIGFTSICPSWVGRVRETMEEKTGALVAYFTGTAGNQVTHSKIESEQHGLDWRQYGIRLGEMASSHVEEMVPVKGDSIRTAREWLELDINHSQDHLLPAANRIQALKKEGKTEEAAQKMKEAGFASAAHVNAVKMRAEMAQSAKVELGAFSIGEIGFVTNTLETFADQGLFVKENSPFKHNFIITSCRGYIACDEAYDYIAYEVHGSSAYYARGAAEKMANKWVEMLKEIHQ